PSAPMLSLGAGVVREHDALLGSQAAGAFGQLAADTVFVRAGLKGEAGRWSLSALGELGQVSAAVADSSLIEEISRLSTSAFRLSASRSLDNGAKLRLSLSQPLRVEGGSMDYTLADGIKDGVVTGKSFSAPLSPSGRQVDLTTTVELPLAEGRLSLGVSRSAQPQHQHQAAPEWVLFTTYRVTW
ncbi:MAG: hypothetical protein OXH24_11225, partial [Cyanobacteria bacterium MAG IRC3_bin_20]|nr:hypothetical protein [Cyanobacteria bacterium MAG IRC3_bin_20]